MSSEKTIHKLTVSLRELITEADTWVDSILKEYCDAKTQTFSIPECIVTMCVAKWKHLWNQFDEAPRDVQKAVANEMFQLKQRMSQTGTSPESIGYQNGIHYAYTYPTRESRRQWSHDMEHKHMMADMFGI